MSAIPPELIQAIRVAAETGSVVYGLKSVKKLVLHGKAKLVVLAANAPPEVKSDINYYAKLSGIPVLIFPGTNMELGSIMGRPHSVMALAVVNPGQSNILELAKGVRSGE